MRTVNSLRTKCKQTMEQKKTPTFIIKFQICFLNETDIDPNLNTIHFFFVLINCLPITSYPKLTQCEGHFKIFFFFAFKDLKTS
jgi:hypothetical protein